MFGSHCAVTRFDAVYAKIMEVPDMPMNSSPHPDPVECGFKYNFTLSRSQFRNQWYLPPRGAAEDIDKEVIDGVRVQYSSEGCAKVRWKKTTKRDRSGLWIWVCMRHHMVVGYHMMPKAEGLRDAIHSLQRFKEHAPKTVFIDFACGCEETALNWAPVYYKDTQFHHDAFHGMSHKCSSRFKSKRFAHFKVLDTSIMEQLNYALAPLKGIVMGPKTKVVPLLFQFFIRIIALVI